MTIYNLLKFCAWLLGCIYVGVGLMLVLKLLYILVHGDTIQPLWVHVIMTIGWGCLPLFLGIFLLLRRYQRLKRFAAVLCVVGVIIFGLASIIHLMNPTTIPRQLGIVAVMGLSFTLLSAIVWMLTYCILRSRMRNGRY